MDLLAPRATPAQPRRLRMAHPSWMATLALQHDFIGAEGLDAAQLALVEALHTPGD